jgi:hypothetical protein
MTTPTKKHYNQKHSRKRKRGKDEVPTGPEVAQYHRELLPFKPSFINSL